MFKLFRTLLILTIVLIDLNLMLYALNHVINPAPVIVLNAFAILSIAVITTAQKINEQQQQEEARNNLINRIKNQYL